MSRISPRRKELSDEWKYLIRDTKKIIEKYFGIQGISDEKILNILYGVMEEYQNTERNEKTNNGENPFSSFLQEEDGTFEIERLISIGLSL